MRNLPMPEELVAAYWRKLTRSIENRGAKPPLKVHILNGRLQSRARLGMSQRPGPLRNGKSLPATQAIAHVR